MSVGSEPSWHVELGGDENGGGGARGGELEKGREVEHEKRRAVESGGRGRRRRTRERVRKGIATQAGGTYPRSADGDTYIHRLGGWEAQGKRSIVEGETSEGCSDQRFSVKRMEWKEKTLTLARRMRILLPSMFEVVVEEDVR